MKKVYTIILLSLLLLTGCGEKEASSPVAQTKAFIPPAVTNIPLLEKDLYLPPEKSSDKKLVFRADVTQDDEITFLYQYQKEKKSEFELATLQPDDTWKVSTPKWEQALLEKTTSPLSTLDVYSDGSYLAMIQPEDDLPSFYYLTPDGNVTEWELPHGILEWTDEIHEMANGILLTEKNQIVLTTYKTEIDEQTGKPAEGMGPDMGHMIVYDPYTKKLISKRDYVDMAANIFIIGDYVFCSGDNEVQVYPLNGGGIQSVYTDKELQRVKNRKDIQQSLCTYAGGKYAYWYTHLGIYRLDVSLTDNAENPVEKIISPDYFPKTDKKYFGINTMICKEDGKTTTIYVRGVPYDLKTNDEEYFTVDASEQIFTRYVFQEP